MTRFHVVARMESFNQDTEYIISRANLSHLLDVEWKNKNSKLKLVQVKALFTPSFGLIAQNSLFTMCVNRSPVKKFLCQEFFSETFKFKKWQNLGAGSDFSRQLSYYRQLSVEQVEGLVAA